MKRNERKKNQTQIRITQGVFFFIIINFLWKLLIFLFSKKFSDNGLILITTKKKRKISPTVCASLLKAPSDWHVYCHCLCGVEINFSNRLISYLASRVTQKKSTNYSTRKDLQTVCAISLYLLTPFPFFPNCLWSLPASSESHYQRPHASVSILGHRGVPLNNPGKSALVFPLVKV